MKELAFLRRTRTEENRLEADGEGDLRYRIGQKTDLTLGPSFLEVLN